MRLSHTRAIIDAIHSGELARQAFREDPVFGLAVPTQCPGVPGNVLDPLEAWESPEAYWQAAADLAERFTQNFAQFADQTEQRVRDAGPILNLQLA